MYGNGSITLTKQAFVSLLNGLFNPNPDDSGDPHNPWGPYGPGGPVIRERLLWALLNPQPLPPRGPHPDPWRFEPDPHPWRAALLVRTVIDRAVANYQFAEVVAGMENSERLFEAVGSQIREFVDDFCGTRPPRWPHPWPWPPKWHAADLRPVDLFIAGAQFQNAADAMENNPLQADFSAAADKLIETGLRRMQGHREAVTAG